MERNFKKFRQDYETLLDLLAQTRNVRDKAQSPEEKAKWDAEVVMLQERVHENWKWFEDHFPKTSSELGEEQDIFFEIIKEHNELLCGYMCPLERFLRCMRQDGIENVPIIDEFK